MGGGCSGIPQGARVNASGWMRELRGMLAREDPHAAIVHTSRHLLVVLSNGQHVLCSKTPGDRRALLNARALVRRLLRIHETR